MGKTILFALLIFAMTLALTLGVSVWTSVAQFLDECDEFFTTIGLVEYTGTEYPDDTANDIGMANAITSFQSAVIANDNATLLWNESTRALGYSDGFWRSDKYMPGRMNSVFVVGSINYDQMHHHYVGIIMDVIYSLKGRVNTLVYIDEDFYPFENDHYYLVIGEVYEIGSPIMNMGAATYDNAIAASLGIEIPRIEDITSNRIEESYIIPDDSVLLRVANTLQVTNNSLLVSETDDLMSIMPFHQEELYFIEGRAFTADEYKQGDKVMVISDLIAARLGIGIGDAIDLSIAVANYAGVYNSFWADTGFSYKATFRVVGITNTVSDKSWYVYVPKSADVPSSPFPIGYTVGHAIVNNDDAASFFARIEPILKNRFQLTIYDQGYSNVAIPFKTILSVAKIVTVVCLLVELAVIILFGFLFVYRQRETSKTMLFLGAGRLRVLGYFLFSAGLISLIATAAGAMVGYFLHDRIISLVTRAAENYTLIDSRFSNGNLSISRTLEFAPHLKLQLFVCIGAAAFTLAMLACIAFVFTTFPNRRSSRQISGGPKKGRTSHLGGGSLKYTFLSIRRGGARSMVVPILSMVVVIFFGQLATTSLRYQKQLNTIYDNTSISGSYMDINGKQVGNLVLNAFDIANLYRTGQITTLTVSKSEPYRYLGTSILADGTDLNIPPLFVPSGGFAAASMEASILRGPNLTATNDIYKAPEFLNADTVFMNFLDGYNESILTVPFEDKRVFSCLVPTSLMEEQAITLGDTIRAAINERTRSTEHDDARIFRHYDLHVVGSYEKQGAEDTIYVPLGLLFDTSFLWDTGHVSMDAPTKTFSTGYTINDTQKDLLLSTTFNSAYFKLSDTRSLVKFKDYLTNYGYSQVHKVSEVREFIVLQDASFNNSVASVKQQIQYINTLYPFLYVLVGIIAIVVSYLTVVSRKMECAIMRGLGTTRIRSFFSFFTEQGFLCLLGIIIGFLIWLHAFGLPRLLHAGLTTGFFVCYLIGSAVSVTIMNHANVLTILRDKE